MSLRYSSAAVRLGRGPGGHAGVRDDGDHAPRVALFANWSLLSNVTSYFVLLAHPTFRRGDFIRVIDIDNYTDGYISELNLFNTKLITENREVILNPNNLLLSRPMLVNPGDRLNGMGKIGVPAAAKTDLVTSESPPMMEDPPPPQR